MRPLRHQRRLVSTLQEFRAIRNKISQATFIYLLSFAVFFAKSNQLCCMPVACIKPVDGTPLALTPADQTKQCAVCQCPLTALLATATTIPNEHQDTSDTWRDFLRRMSRGAPPALSTYAYICSTSSRAQIQNRSASTTRAISIGQYS